MNGIPQIKVAVAVPQEERFTAPRPAFNAPQNAEHLTPQPRDNRPAESLVERTKREGKDILAEKIAKAQEAAKQAMARANGEKVTTPKPRVNKGKKSKVQTPGMAPVSFQPEDVCDPETFIKRTRSGDYHTPEMKRLFYANGGEVYMKAGISYANAFSNLRSDMMKRIKK